MIIRNGKVLGTTPYKRLEDILKWKGRAGQSSIELNTQYYVSHYLCKLKITHTNGANPTFGDDDLFNIITRLELLGNGKKALKSINGTKLKLNTYLAHTTGSKKNLNKTADTADLESYVWFWLPANVFGTVRPHDTILKTHDFTKLNLIVTFNSADSLGTNITVTNAEIEVYSHSQVGYQRRVGEYTKYFVESQEEYDVNSDSHNYQIKLNQHRQYKALTLVATDQGKRSNAVIEEVVIKAGNTTIINMPYEAIQVLNEYQFRPQDINELKGVAIIDFVQRGYLTDVLNTDLQDFKNLEFVLKVKKLSENTKIMVYMDEIEDHPEIVDVPA